MTDKKPARLSDEQLDGWREKHFCTPAERKESPCELCDEMELLIAEVRAGRELRRAWIAQIPSLVKLGQMTQGCASSLLNALIALDEGDRPWVTRRRSSGGGPT